ncbi:hypothetical protein BC831DRAFT_247556 [Entophlyctis helioformis]|nr:hypothetical protein BC831DRAFT_247556 [Entophlyctis helioformis]
MAGGLWSCIWTGGSRHACKSGLWHTGHGTAARHSESWRATAAWLQCLRLPMQQPCGHMDSRPCGRWSSLAAGWPSNERCVANPRRLRLQLRSPPAGRSFPFTLNPTAAHSAAHWASHAVSRDSAACLRRMCDWQAGSSDRQAGRQADRTSLPRRRLDECQISTAVYPRHQPPGRQLLLDLDGSRHWHRGAQHPHLDRRLPGRPPSPDPASAAGHQGRQRPSSQSSSAASAASQAAARHGDSAIDSRML